MSVCCLSKRCIEAVELTCLMCCTGEVASISDKWRLVDLFLEYKGLVTQHIDTCPTVPELDVSKTCFKQNLITKAAQAQDSYNHFVLLGAATHANTRK